MIQSTFTSLTLIILNFGASDRVHISYWITLFSCICCCVQCPSSIRLNTSSSCTSSPLCLQTGMPLLNRDIGWTSFELDLHECLWLEKGTTATEPSNLPASMPLKQALSTSYPRVNKLRQFTVVSLWGSVLSETHSGAARRRWFDYSNTQTCEICLHASDR